MLESKKKIIVGSNQNHYHTRKEISYIKIDEDDDS